MSSTAATTAQASTPVVDAAAVQYGAAAAQGSDGYVAYGQTGAVEAQVTDPTTGQTANIAGSETNVTAADGQGNNLNIDDQQGAVEVNGQAVYGEQATATGTVVDPTTGEQDQVNVQQTTVAGGDDTGAGGVTYTTGQVTHPDGTTESIQDVSGAAAYADPTTGDTTVAAGEAAQVTGNGADDASGLYDDPFAAMNTDNSGTAADGQNVSDVTDGVNNMGLDNSAGYDNSGYDNSGYDATAADGTAADGTAADGTAADGTAADGTAADGTAYDNSGYDNSGYDASGYDPSQPDMSAMEGTGFDGTGGYDPTQAGVDTCGAGADMGVATY